MKNSGELWNGAAWQIVWIYLNICTQWWYSWAVSMPKAKTAWIFIQISALMVTRPWSLPSPRRHTKQSRSVQDTTNIYVSITSHGIPIGSSPTPLWQSKAEPSTCRWTKAGVSWRWFQRDGDTSMAKVEKGTIENSFMRCLLPISLQHLGWWHSSHGECKTRNRLHDISRYLLMQSMQ